MTNCSETGGGLQLAAMSPDCTTVFSAESATVRLTELMLSTSGPSPT